MIPSCCISMATDSSFEGELLICLSVSFNFHV